jgi:hypothetical protein
MEDGAPDEVRLRGHGIEAAGRCKGWREGGAVDASGDRNIVPGGG